MTAPDIAGLCERLRRLKPVLSTPQHGGWVGQPRNPDGPEAADTLERQAAEIARMRGAASEARNWLNFAIHEDWTPDSHGLACHALDRLDRALSEGGA